MPGYRVSTQASDSTLRAGEYVLNLQLLVGIVEPDEAMSAGEVDGGGRLLPLHQYTGARQAYRSGSAVSCKSSMEADRGVETGLTSAEHGRLVDGVPGRD